jgi:Zn ribbon nucleic-acid-binding protein
MTTTCEECGTRLTLTLIDADGVLIGDECPKCGYYVTRYMPGQEPR